jgi:dienelactone hydrolase
MSGRKVVVVLSALFLAGTPAAVRGREGLPGFALDGTQWTYRDDSLSMKGVLLKPDGPGPFPAILISHGKGGDASQFGRAKAREFLRWGFVCIAPGYTHERGAGGAGRGAAPDDGASEENLRRASRCLDILESLPYVDKARIAAYGHSMGGFVTIGLAARSPGRLAAAAISGSGVSPRDGFPAPSTDRARAIRTPFLILHGSEDRTVRPEQSGWLEEVLDENKVPHERHVFPGEGHPIDRTKSAEVFDLMRAWFTKYHVLKGESPAPSAPPRDDAPGRRGPATPAPNAQGARDRQPSWRMPPVEGPNLRYKTFDSRLAGEPVSYLIYLPPDYDAARERRYPVVYWLHGLGGSQQGVPVMAGRLTRAIEEGKAPAMIVVYANGMVRSSYVDSRDGKTPVETVAIRELIPHIDATYRTIASREGRMIEGFSMGGAGAAKWALRHPDLFGSISILDGALHSGDPATGPMAASFETIYGGDRAYYDAHDPWKLAEKAAGSLKGRTTIRIVTRTTGLGDANRRYHEHLGRLGLAHEFHAVPDAPHSPNPLYEGLGDRNWSFYREAFRDAVRSQDAAEGR